MKGPLFYAKILLFGEYGIIKDSKGLSIPYNFFRGALKIPHSESEITKKSHSKLISFANYLRKIDTKIVSFDWMSIEKDLSQKLFFDSSIPQGYGVGSSGALVAAFYDRYAADRITILENLTTEKLQKLKVVFSTMESFFHVKSSGLDPLNSSLSLPLLIHSSEQIETTGIPSQNLEGKGAVFLLDTGVFGETAPMVSLFFENMKDEGFSKMMRDQFTTTTDRCVEDFLNANIKSLFKNIKSLSSLVLNNFKPMIPNHFHELWKKGIDSNAYYLKLCGSGGGGYMLGFTEDFEAASKELEGHRLEVVYHF